MLCFAEGIFEPVHLGPQGGRPQGCVCTGVALEPKGATLMQSLPDPGVGMFVI